MGANYISDNDCTLLFFILVFLKLFYKPGYIDTQCSVKGYNDDTLLFFILVFLKLFYK